MPHVSPSQIGTKRGCFRKWAYSRQRPRSTNRFAEFGTRGHTIAEDWLQYAKAPDANTPEGACMLAGLEYLPMPGSDMKVEQKFTETWGGVEYTGRIDLLYGYDPGRCVVICDHKTTGDLKHMMTLDGIKPDGEYDAEKDFRIDPQRIIYSYWAAQMFNVPYVVAHWQYYRRKPPKSLPIVMTDSRENIEARFWELHEQDALPIVHAAGIPPEQFPRTLTHCSAFGGCPYQDECHTGVSAIDRAAAQLFG